MNFDGQFLSFFIHFIDYASHTPTHTFINMHILISLFPKKTKFFKKHFYVKNPIFLILRFVNLENQIRVNQIA